MKINSLWSHWRQDFPNWFILVCIKHKVEMAFHWPPQVKEKVVNKVKLHHRNDDSVSHLLQHFSPCGCVTPLPCKGNRVRLCFPPDWEQNRWGGDTSLMLSWVTYINVGKQNCLGLEDDCLNARAVSHFFLFRPWFSIVTALATRCCHSAPRWPTYS